MPYKQATHEQRTRAKRVGAMRKDYDHNRRVRGEGQRIRHSMQWRRFRTWYLNQHPICEDPFNTHAKVGEVVPAIQVHHKIGIVGNPELALSEDNCMAICTKCHARMEAKVR